MSLAIVVSAALAGAAFVAALYGVVSILAPKHPYPAKCETYECGNVPIGEPWVPFKVQYYVFAVLFVIVDIETAFFFPWAVIHKSLSWLGFAEVVAFVLVLLVGYAYAWRKGAFKWV